MAQKQQDVGALQEELNSLKCIVKGAEGQIALLKFQLQKEKSKSQNGIGRSQKSAEVEKKEQSAVPNTSNISIPVGGGQSLSVSVVGGSTFQSPDRIAWLRHWRQSRIVCGDIKKAKDKIFSEETVEKSENEDEFVVLDTPEGVSVTVTPGKRKHLSAERSSSATPSSPPDSVGAAIIDTIVRKLAVQERLNYRLESQLRSWVDAQILMHKQLAEEEVPMLTVLKDDKLPARFIIKAVKAESTKSVKPTEEKMKTLKLDSSSETLLTASSSASRRTDVTSQTTSMASLTSTTAEHSTSTCSTREFKASISSQKEPVACASSSEAPSTTSSSLPPRPTVLPTAAPKTDDGDYFFSPSSTSVYASDVESLYSSDISPQSCGEGSASSPVGEDSNVDVSNTAVANSTGSSPSNMEQFLLDSSQPDDAKEHDAVINASYAEGSTVFQVSRSEVSGYVSADISCAVGDNSSHGSPTDTLGIANSAVKESLPANTLLSLSDTSMSYHPHDMYAHTHSGRARSSAVVSGAKSGNSPTLIQSLFRGLAGELSSPPTAQQDNHQTSAASQKPSKTKTDDRPHLHHSVAIDNTWSTASAAFHEDRQPATHTSSSVRALTQLTASSTISAQGYHASATGSTKQNTWNFLEESSVMEEGDLFDALNSSLDQRVQYVLSTISQAITGTTSDALHCKDDKGNELASKAITSTESQVKGVIETANSAISTAVAADGLIALSGHVTSQAKTQSLVRASADHSSQNQSKYSTGAYSTEMMRVAAVIPPNSTTVIPSIYTSVRRRSVDAGSSGGPISLVTTIPEGSLNTSRESVVAVSEGSTVISSGRSFSAPENIVTSQRGSALVVPGDAPDPFLNPLVKSATFIPAPMKPYGGRSTPVSTDPIPLKNTTSVGLGEPLKTWTDAHSSRPWLQSADKENTFSSKPIGNTSDASMKMRALSSGVVSTNNTRTVLQDRSSNIQSIHSFGAESISKQPSSSTVYSTKVIHHDSSLHGPTAVVTKTSSEPSTGNNPTDYSLSGHIVPATSRPLYNYINPSVNPTTVTATTTTDSSTSTARPLHANNAPASTTTIPATANKNILSTSTVSVPSTATVTSTEGSVLSPLSFRTHMNRLREENYLIKNDINRFRSTLQKLRDECSETNRRALGMSQQLNVSSTSSSAYV